MQIYVISIEENDSIRLKQFFSQPFFSSLNVRPKRMGVKGADLLAKEYFEQAVKGREIPLTPGELGCTLSHLQALKDFLSTEDSHALIFEDDAIIPKHIQPDLLIQEIGKLDLPAKSLLSLGGIQMKESRKVRGKLLTPFLFDQKVLEVIPDYYHRVNYAMAYMVDREMAQLLLQYHHPLRRADDWSCLYDFDATVHLYMVHLIDHPVIQKGETNQALSAIEAERVDQQGLRKSKYGNSLRRNLAKLFSERYF
ncbi:glycosyltransferase family 25 protein [Acinetobacter baylyi]|uniref:glycosyltransferase family 25 protein n=1 Tax=Acinetobacter baylyi TaxID=202950 RepID=UPI0031E12AA7